MSEGVEMLNVEIHHWTDRAALYVDGTLLTQGGLAEVRERLNDLLGVKIVGDSSFLRGSNMTENIAHTVEQIEKYRNARKVALEKANKLEEEARGLFADARHIKSQYQ